MTPATKSKISDAPMAVASDGSVLVNATHLDGTTEVLDAVQKLAPSGCEVFIGVVVPLSDRRRIAKDIEDAVAEIVCRVGGRLGRRSR